MVTSSMLKQASSEDAVTVVSIGVRLCLKGDSRRPGKLVCSSIVVLNRIVFYWPDDRQDDRITFVA